MVKIPCKAEKMPLGHTYISGTVCRVRSCKELAGAVSQHQSQNEIGITSVVVVGLLRGLGLLNIK